MIFVHTRWGGGKVTREIDYLDSQDIMLITTSGTYELETEVETLKNVIAKSNDKHCSKYLFDHRNTTMVARTLGAYHRPDIYRTLGFERSMRMAIVLRELDDAMRFYEIVCMNRGWNVKIFDDYAVAVGWLSE